MSCEAHVKTNVRTVGLEVPVRSASGRKRAIESNIIIKYAHFKWKCVDSQKRESWKLHNYPWIK
eukprot:138082-Prorocentrum_minimum.AAC.1